MGIKQRIVVHLAELGTIIAQSLLNKDLQVNEDSLILINF